MNKLKLVFLGLTLLIFSHTSFASNVEFEYEHDVLALQRVELPKTYHIKSLKIEFEYSCDLQDQQKIASHSFEIDEGNMNSFFEAESIGAFFQARGARRSKGQPLFLQSIFFKIAFIGPVYRYGDENSLISFENGDDRKVFSKEERTGHGKIHLKDCHASEADEETGVVVRRFSPRRFIINFVEDPDTRDLGADLLEVVKTEQ